MADVPQQENQLQQAVRGETANAERAEYLRDKLYQMLDRLRGPMPSPAPEQGAEKATLVGSMVHLRTQQERTGEAVETAIQTLSEIEQYV